jgi:tetratricopeptide (TPR) repeat protein
MGIRMANVVFAVALAATIAALGLAGLRGARAVTRVSGPLVPSAEAVRYRHPIAATRGMQGAELDATIAQLEARTRGAVVSPMELADLADLYMKRFDFAKAESAARRSLALLRYPSSAPLTLAKLASARHDFRGAIALAREHLMHTKSAGALGVLAAAHLALGELDRAAEAATWAIGVRPDSGAYLMRALVEQAQRRDADAAADFTRAAQREEGGDPDEAARLRALWGRFLLSRGECTAAELVLAEAQRIAPTHALATAQRGHLAMKRGRAKQAARLFEDAFITSHQTRYLIDRAAALDAAGEQASAASTRAQAERMVRAELRDTGVGHRLELVELLADRGDRTALAEALPLAFAELTLRPSDDTRAQLIRVLGGSPPFVTNCAR